MYYVLWFEQLPGYQGSDSMRHMQKYLANARTSARNIALRCGTSDVRVVDDSGNVKFRYTQLGNEIKE